MNMHRPPTRGILSVRAEASPDVKPVIDELQKAFSDFQAANDDRIAALEKGRDDAITNETVDKINGHVTVLQEKLDDALKQASAATAGADEALKVAQRLAVGGNPDAAKSLQDLQANARSFAAVRLGKPIDDIREVDVEQYQTYCAAFRSFIRRGGADGELLPGEVRADLMSGSDAEGGFWVPTEMASRVQTRLFETSDIRNIATVESTTADSWELPIDVDEAESGGWVSERETRNDTDNPRTGIQKIETHEQYAQPRATQRILDDATRDVEGWLAGKIGDKLSRTENTAFVSGTGSGQPRGIFSYGAASLVTDDSSRAWGVLQHIISGSATGFPTVSGSTASDPDALITMISKLKPFYRGAARWLMNRATEAAIRKLKDADGRYLVGMGDIRDGVVGFNLFGYQMSTAEDVADIASDAFAIAFGDFGAGYTIIDRQGLRVLRDPYTSKPFVKFYTTKRVGGDVTDFDAIKLMKFAAS
jgi:HK97 family phage major capsid protein